MGFRLLGIDPVPMTIFEPVSQSAGLADTADLQVAADEIPSRESPESTGA